MRINNQACTVGALLEELYKKAAAFSMWGLVRHTAGMLHKRVEDLGVVSSYLFTLILSSSLPPFPSLPSPPSLP